MPNKSVREVIDAMTEEQQTAVYALLGAALEPDDDLSHSGMSDEDVKNIFSLAKRNGSLKDAILEHCNDTLQHADYGIKDIDLLFPEASLANGVQKVKNDKEWVNKVMSGVHKLPFAKVKTLFADLSKESLRAKGYIKGSMKTETVFELLKRTTEPVTVYKKEKMDRDDLIDVTDFEIVAWIKAELKEKLNEEIARAILIGDGRLTSDQYKIDETCIRPIYNDDDFFTVKVGFDVDESVNVYKEFITQMTINRKLYKGSGSPTLFTTEDMVSGMLLLEDSVGRRLYKSMEDLKAVLRVSDIVTVDDMEGLVRKTSDNKVHTVLALMVNLNDYSVGSNKGGQTSMFEDFDIDYNQQKYLIEARCSGALTKPYSAMVIETVETPAQ